MLEITAVRPGAVAPGSPVGATDSEALRAAVRQEGERRRIIKQFVRSELEAGRDYGTIQVSGKSGAISQSKPVLFKSGMEKIFSLFHVVSVLERDMETVEMIGKPGVIAYKCKLYRGSEFVAEGRGAASVEERGRVNDAIKIAEKRARMDACLTLGFSEYFTQDLEDLPDAAPADTAPAAQEPTAWRDGEVRDLTFTVQDKEMKTAHSGTRYALLQTDAGSLRAWKNTYDKFEAGRTYRAAVEGTIWNQQLSLVVIRIYEQALEDSQPAKSGTGQTT